MALNKINTNNASPGNNTESLIVRAKHFNPLVDEVTSMESNTSDINAINSTLSNSGLTTKVSVVIDANDIVGTSAGDIGHVDGAVLVTAPTSDYFLEFISAVLVYKYDTAAYTGGSDDLVIQVGGVGTQLSLSTTITDANLTTAAGDKIVRLGAITTETGMRVGSALSIAGTAYTNPGLPEITTFQITAAEDTGGIVDITLGGVTYNIPITADTVDNNAIEIQTYLDLIPALTATVLTDTVTVIINDDGVQTDGSFAQGTANSSACTVVVTQQGVNAAAGEIKINIEYRTIETGL